MFKSFSKKLISVTICLALLLMNLAYADTVVVGIAPGTESRTMSANASTTYLQNQFTGPGTLPNSSTTNYSPIQGVSYDYSIGQSLSGIDQHNAENKGPTTKVITSPGTHNQELATVTGNSNVITNGLVAGRVSADNTADLGPTVHEITSPADNNTSLMSDNTGPGAGGPGSVNGAEVPSYSTQNNQGAASAQAVQVNQNVDTFAAANNGIILYTVNNSIQALKPGVSADAALVVNATTRQIYFSKGGLNPYHPAALTNLVTASLLLTYKKLDDVLIVSPTAVTGLESGASTAGLRAGDMITVRDAIAAMFVRSCCDVANVAAENVAGSIPNFVALMNQTVRNWGCVGTNFTNPTGLNNNAQVTNTYDAAIIMDKVSQDPTLKLLLQQQSYVLPATAHRGAKALTATNQLLIKGNKNYYNGISASKSGYTSKAKYTVASMIEYNGQRLIAIVLKANGSQWTDSTKLLNFAKVASIEAAATGNNTTVVSVTNNVSAQAMVANNLAASNAILSNAAATNAMLTNVAANAAVASSDTAGTWQKDAKGWYFIKANGQSAANEWIKQGGKMYCVDSTGYMITGWRQMSNGEMYYFDPNTGEMRHSTWVNVSTGAYYLQADGTLAKAPRGSTKSISTSVGTYSIDENGKAIAKIS